MSVLTLLALATSTAFAESSLKAAPGEQAPSAELVALAREIEAELRTARGQTDGHRIDIAVWSEEKLRAELAGPPAAAATFDPFAATLSLLGVRTPAAHPDAGDTSGAVPLGLYQPESHRLIIVDHLGVDSDSLQLRMTLAHEVGHALDDEAVGLSGLNNGDSLDAAIARKAVIEGSAMVAEQASFQRWLTGQVHDDADRHDLDRRARREDRRMNRRVRRSPAASEPSAWTQVWTVFPYTSGLRFFDRAEAQAGSPLLPLAEVMPVSTEQILHPADYWSSQPDLPKVIDAASFGAILSPLGLQLAWSTTAGELLTAMALQGDTFDMSEPTSLNRVESSGWGGDLFGLCVSAEHPDRWDGQAVWLSTWDSSADRDEFIAGLSAWKVREDVSAAWARVGEKEVLVTFFIEKSDVDALIRQADQVRITDPTAPAAPTEPAAPQVSALRR